MCSLPAPYTHARTHAHRYGASAGVKDKSSPRGVDCRKLTMQVLSQVPPVAVLQDNMFVLEHESGTHGTVSQLESQGSKLSNGFCLLFLSAIEPEKLRF